MPITPLHFGPGAAIKAVIPRHFSFTVFCFAQVITDCETAYYMFQGLYPWHRFFHTYVGATIVAAFSVLGGRPVCQVALRVWTAWRDAPFNQIFPSSPIIPWRSAIIAAFIGTYSHVVLDSIMHSDITPLMPFSASNPLYQVMGVSTLNLSCVVLGLFGAFHVAFTNGRSA